MRTFIISIIVMILISGCNPPDGEYVLIKTVLTEKGVSLSRGKDHIFRFWIIHLETKKKIIGKEILEVMDTTIEAAIIQHETYVRLLNRNESMTRKLVE